MVIDNNPQKLSVIQKIPSSGWVILDYVFISNTATPQEIRQILLFCISTQRKEGTLKRIDLTKRKHPLCFTLFSKRSIREVSLSSCWLMLAPPPTSDGHDVWVLSWRRARRANLPGMMSAGCTESIFSASISMGFGFVLSTGIPIPGISTLKSKVHMPMRISKEAYMQKTALN